jgi:hypothetical protein
MSSMEAHAHFFGRLRVPHLHLVHRETTGSGRLAWVGAAAGIGGCVALAAPLVIYDWVRAGHSALELPMAVSGWLFGLEHFARNDYRWWPIVLGALILLAYWAVLGMAFAGIADRVYRVRTLAGCLALGAVWSFVSFVFFWDMLLPIAREGAPLRQTAAYPEMFVAPNWVWILGFALSGLVAGICYRTLAVASATSELQATAAGTSQQAA